MATWSYFISPVSDVLLGRRRATRRNSQGLHLRKNPDGRTEEGTDRCCHANSWKTPGKLFINAIILKGLCWRRGWSLELKVVVPAGCTKAADWRWRPGVHAPPAPQVEQALDHPAGSQAGPPVPWVNGQAGRSVDGSQLRYRQQVFRCGRPAVSARDQERPDFRQCWPLEGTCDRPPEKRLGRAAKTTKRCHQVNQIHLWAEMIVVVYLLKYFYTTFSAITYYVFVFKWLMAQYKGCDFMLPDVTLHTFL